jgi:A/G-specific adenine glycosylase
MTALSPVQARRFRASLLVWFDAHKRDLPWRRTRDPYAIWVSEIMLQQTRVAAVLDHYERWMQRFPTVQALAAASEDEVLAAWSGLGYYRRARFLHRGAQAVVGEHHGRMAATATALRALPGIGPYTSAAIASIAFDEAVAVVDGNVERVLLRQAGASEAGAEKRAHDGAEARTLRAGDFQTIAALLLDRQRPGDFNQAMMELGATICLPRRPLCLQCPVQSSCRTRGEHPTAGRKAGLQAEICYGLATRQQSDELEILMRQRSAEATVMPGMWELPEIPVSAIENETPILRLRHAIMRTTYLVGVYAIPRGDPAFGLHDDQPRVMKVSDLPFLPLTGLARKIFTRLELPMRR